MMTNLKESITGARGIAIRILVRIEQSDAYLDKLLDAELRDTSLADLDKRLLTELATGVVRWQIKLDWVLGRHYSGNYRDDCDPLPKCALRLALYQILFLDRIPASAAINESVQIVKVSAGPRAAGIVNAVLRAIVREKHLLTEPEPVQDPMLAIAVRHSHPRWMARRWTKRYGMQQAEALMRANNVRPRLSLRVATSKTSREQLCYTLEQQGIVATPGKYDPDVLHVDRLPEIASNAAFRQGLFIVQDESAALAARLADARSGMRVVDICASPGGKSMTMGFMMESLGQIVAVDMYASKLERIAETAERVGLSGLIRPTTGDARAIVLDPADVVLVDAPCSGLGVIRRKPDIKWRRRPEDIEAMSGLQSRMLLNAARLVAEGGHLIYTTCTMEPRENEQIVESFLHNNSEFSLVNAGEVLPEEVVGDGGYLQTLPHLHGIDGAFGARMRRGTRQEG